MEQVPTPPLGLKPRWLHEEHKRVYIGHPFMMHELELLRCFEVKDAIFRYHEAGKEIPIEWLIELDHIVNTTLTSSN